MKVDSKKSFGRGSSLEALKGEREREVSLERLLWLDFGCSFKSVPSLSQIELKDL